MAIAIDNLPHLTHSVSLGEVIDQSHINDTAAVVGPICVAVIADPNLPVMIAVIFF
jgi:hypothetical protein